MWQYAIAFYSVQCVVNLIGLDGFILWGFVVLSFFKWGEKQVAVHARSVTGNKWPTTETGGCFDTTATSPYRKRPLVAQ